MPEQWTVVLPPPGVSVGPPLVLSLDEVDLDPADELLYPIEFGHPLGLKQLKNPDDLDRLFGKGTPSPPVEKCHFEDAAFENKWIVSFRLVSSTGALTFRCHKYVAPVLKRAFLKFAYLMRTGGLDYSFRSVGGYYARYMKTPPAQVADPKSKWHKKPCKYLSDSEYSVSVHTWGAAIDINEHTNQQGSSRGNIPVVVVNILERAGFLWGGRFRGAYIDPMHFEWADPKATFPKS